MVNACVLGSFFLVAVGQAGAASASGSDPLYVGLRHEPFFASLNLGIRERTIDDRGIGYGLDPRGRLKNLFVILAVHKTTDEAIAMFDLRSKRSSGVGPDSTDASLGNECAVWVSGPDATKIDPVLRENGTVLFRRSNLLILSGWRGESAEALSLAREMDILIQSDREIAPIGEFEETPEIVSVPLPEEDDANAERTTVPVIRGMGDPTRVLFRAEVVRGTERLSDERESTGKLKMRIPRNSDQTDIRILAASDDNVFVTKIVSVRIRGGAERVLPTPRPVVPEK